MSERALGVGGEASVGAGQLQVEAQAGGVRRADDAGVVVQGELASRLLAGVAGDARAIEDRPHVAEIFDVLRPLLEAQAAGVVGVPLLARLVERLARYKGR